MTTPSTVSGGTQGATSGPHGPIVVIHGTLSAVGLLESLVRVAPRGDGPAVVCLGTCGPAEVAELLEREGLAQQLRYESAPSIKDGIRPLVELLRSIDIASARSIVVLPQRNVAEPDASSRVVCVAIGQACGDAPIPNTVVEVEDPEAAFEFAGLHVATVFYPGYLRAALLAQACVDLGVFQFVCGLLDGRYRVRLIDIPEALKGQSFLDAALEIESDEEDKAITVIGVQNAKDGALQINPGPRSPLSQALGLLALEGT